MGRYLQVDSRGRLLGALTKASALIIDGAVPLAAAPLTAQAPDGSYPFVCVICNGLFEAAAWIFSDVELRDCTDPADPRQKTWLHYPAAAQLCDPTHNRSTI